MTLRFYFDYISSNAYLAWKDLPRLVGRYGLTVEPVPVLFAGLLNAHGTVGPAETPAKPRTAARRAGNCWLAPSCRRERRPSDRR